MRRALPPLLLLALAGAVQGHARSVPWPQPTAQKAPADDSVPAAVLEGRAVLADPQSDVAAISAAATVLLGHRDVDTLRAALGAEPPHVALGVLSALAVVEPQAGESLFEDVVALAARTGQEATRTKADAVLDNFLDGRSPGADARGRRVLEWLGQPGLDAARRDVALRALGRSRSLAYVEPLIGALEGPGAAGARAALRELTGHDLGPDSDAAAWRAFWAENGRLSREQLLERGLQRARDQAAGELARSQARLSDVEQKLVADRIATLGDAIDRLIDRLSDEYAEVRLEAARRLAARANDEKAAAAVPELLERLGRTPPPNGNGHGEGGPGAAGASEPDPRVRAALVGALGVLGRPRESGRTDADAAARESRQRQVREALVAELASPEPAVAAAAAAALEQFRNQPLVVAPLMDYVDRLPAGAEDEQVRALKAIAANAPRGVVERLQAWAEPGRKPAVRAAAVGALFACDEEIDVALESLGQLYGADASRDVRFSLAAALGDRLGRMPPGTRDESRAVVVKVLGTLLSDVEANVRAEAVAALGRSGSPAALERLAQRARAETDAGVQARLVAALGELRLPGGAAVIGELLAARTEGRAALKEAAQQAVTLIAGERAPAPWLAAGEALSAAGAHDVAAYCGAEAVRRFGQAPEHKEATDRARGLQAVELLLDGRAAEARPLLEALAAASAPFPPRDELLLRLAEACERLEDWPAAAGWRKQRLEALPPGDARRGAEVLATVRVLRRAGLNADALPLLEAHVRDNSADNLALFDLAQVEEALGRLEDAQRSLARLVERLPEGDELRPRVDEARARVAQALGAASAPPSVPEGPQRADASPVAPPAGAPGATAGP